MRNSDRIDDKAVFPRERNGGDETICREVVREVGWHLEEVAIG
jgi:hypothetical protein